MFYLSLKRVCLCPISPPYKTSDSLVRDHSEETVHKVTSQELLRLTRQAPLSTRGSSMVTGVLVLC